MRLARVALAAAAVALASPFSHGPAQAAGPYNIAGSNLGFSATEIAWGVQSCNSSFISSPANGLDARVINASAFAGKSVTITWATPASAVAKGFGLSNILTTYNSACVSTTFSGQGIDPLNPNGPNSMRATLPTNTKYLLVRGFGSANINFTIN